MRESRVNSHETRRHLRPRRGGLTRGGPERLEVLRVLPALELAGLVEWTGTGWRVTPQNRTPP
jgi:hypothetical protein